MPRPRITLIEILVYVAIGLIVLSIVIPHLPGVHTGQFPIR